MQALGSFLMNINKMNLQSAPASKLPWSTSLSIWSVSLLLCFSGYINNGNDNVMRFHSCDAFSTSSYNNRISNNISGAAAASNIPRVVSGLETQRQKKKEEEKQKQQQPQQDAFDIFIKMRTGLGSGDGSSDVVFWTGEGELYESPSGNVIAKVDGVEVSKAIYLTKDDYEYERKQNHNNNEEEKKKENELMERDEVVRIFSRKIFWYRDCVTNEIITEYNGEPIRPIKYEWQVFDLYRGDTGVNGNASSIGTTTTAATDVNGAVESNNNANGSNGINGSNNVNKNFKRPFLVPIIPTIIRSPRVLPIKPITPRIVGSPSQLMFQVPLFIDIEIPKIPNDADGKKDGKNDSSTVSHYRAWEFYDYYVNTDFPANNPPSLAWTRNGPNPPFVQDGSGVMHFHAYRVDSFEGLPESIRSIVEEEYPLFRTPPSDMREVDRLISKAKKGN